MKIREKLTNKTKWALKRYIGALRKAIRAECLRCMNIENLRKKIDCDGLNLEDGNCPLYDYRPFKANR